MAVEAGGCLTSTLRVAGEYALATRGMAGKTPLTRASTQGEGKAGE